MPGRQATRTFSSLLKVRNFLTYFHLFVIIEPIEQNVHGNKGIYELVYFIKESKAIDKFKK